MALPKEANLPSPAVTAETPCGTGRDSTPLRGAGKSGASHSTGPKNSSGSEQPRPPASPPLFLGPSPFLHARSLQAERSVAYARMTMVVYLLTAAWVHPLEPVGHALLVRGLLVTYALYSASLLMVVWCSLVPPRYPVARNCGDLIAISALAYLGFGVNGELFPYLAFLLIATGLLWSRQRPPWVGPMMLVAVAATVLGGTLGRPATFQLGDFAIGVVCVVVTATFLVKLEAYKRGRRAMDQLAVDEVDYDDLDSLVRGVPGWAAQALGTDRTLVAWEDPDELSLCLAWFDAGVSRCAYLARGVIEPLVAHAVEEVNFFCRRVIGSHPVFYRSSHKFERWLGSPLHPVLQAQFSMTSVLSVRLEGKTVRGRIFWFDKPSVNSDDLLLGEIVARQVTSRMDGFYLRRQLAAHAVEVERVRIGHDLHDGALQALAGAALELENMQRLSNLDIATCQDRLRQIQSTLEMEQRDLRMVVERLRNGRLAHRPGVCLSVRVKELVERIERQRALRVEWSGATSLDALGTRESYDVFLLLHEALTNAARHSGATALQMSAVQKHGGLSIVVADDGGGFPFKGHYDLRTLTTQNLGPATLKERVTRLGGRLTIESTHAGSRLEIFCPILKSGS
jgi:signal transduction histidine kinase